MNALQNVSIFLIETLFSMYIGAVILRFLLALVRANFYNPVSQFIVKVTNPLLVPLRRVIPPIGKMDTAAIVLALSLTAIKALLLIAVRGIHADAISIVLYTVFDLISAVIHLYIFILIVQAVMSWFGNAYGNPMVDLFQSLTEPLLRPIRRFLPNLGMIDISPMIALLGLYVILIILQSYGLAS
jgi:YggT family protein